MKKERARPYTTDYGTSKGYCATPRGAVRSALVHLLVHGGKHAVIERPDGPPIDVWWHGHWGVSVQQRAGGKIVPFARRKA